VFLSAWSRLFLPRGSLCVTGGEGAFSIFLFCSRSHSPSGGESSLPLSGSPPYVECHLVVSLWLPPSCTAFLRQSARQCLARFRKPHSPAGCPATCGGGFNSLRGLRHFLLALLLSKKKGNIISFLLSWLSYFPSCFHTLLLAFHSCFPVSLLSSSGGRLEERQVRVAPHCWESTNPGSCNLILLEQSSHDCCCECGLFNFRVKINPLWRRSSFYAEDTGVLGQGKA